MRFIRNQILKQHLDNHFKKNNDFRRRGNKAVYRPFFMSIKDFVQPKSSQNNVRNARGKYYSQLIRGIGGQNGGTG
jgi:hypothetical protein